MISLSYGNNKITVTSALEDDISDSEIINAARKLRTVANIAESGLSDDCCGNDKEPDNKFEELWGRVSWESAYVADFVRQKGKRSEGGCSVLVNEICEQTGLSPRSVASRVGAFNRIAKDLEIPTFIEVSLVRGENYVHLNKDGEANLAHYFERDKEQYQRFLLQNQLSNSVM